VLLSVGVGAFLSARLAPVVRRRLSEERIILSVLFLGCAGSVLSAWLGGLRGAVVIGGLVALCSGTAKLAFDSLVQRDAPGANHGRSFARFEGRFQLGGPWGPFWPSSSPSRWSTDTAWWPWPFWSPSGGSVRGPVRHRRPSPRRTPTGQTGSWAFGGATPPNRLAFVGAPRGNRPESGQRASRFRVDRCGPARDRERRPQPE